MLISKRAKVVSDKPAFTEKEKSESGGTIYRYDPKHIEKRWKEKCEKLKRLENNIDKLRKQYDKDLSDDDLRTRAEAALVGIMDDTAMRVGNEDSVKEYETYGATTLKVKHLNFSGSKTTFKFVGKDQVKQDVETSNSKITKVLKELVKDKKDNDFVFEIDGTKIWDRAVNRYLSKFDISAKDLRGFQANRIMKEKLKKKDFKEALEETAKEVGHEPATLKNQYLDPHLVEKYTKKEASLISEASFHDRWWLSPEGTLYKIDKEHTTFMLEHPELFGLDGDVAALSWSAVSKGWIRGGYGFIQLWSFDDSTFQRIQHILSQVTMPLDSPIHLESKNDYRNTSYANLVGAKSFNELKKLNRVAAISIRAEDDILNLILITAKRYNGAIKFHYFKDITKGSFQLSFDISFDKLDEAESFMLEALDFLNYMWMPKKPREINGKYKVSIDFTLRLSPQEIEALKSKISTLDTKKAAISIRAEDLLPFKSSPPVGNIGVDPDKNVGNVSPKVHEEGSADLMMAWRIIAPFLPKGATLTSAFRSNFDQAKTILEFWRSIRWANKGPYTVKPYTGFFYVNFSKMFNLTPEEFSTLYTRATKKWLTKKDIARINQLANFMAFYRPNRRNPLSGEPKSPLSIARIGESEHRFGIAMDIASASIGEIGHAIQFLNAKLPGILNLSRQPYVEPTNQAVHLEFSSTPQMPDTNTYINALKEFTTQYSNATPPTPTKAKASVKQALLNQDDANWLNNIKPSQPPSSANKGLRIEPNVKLNQLILDAWKTLLPFLPKGAVMTSGTRTADDQKRILRNYWSIAGLNEQTPGFGDYYTMSKVLKQHGYVVGPPTTSFPYSHLHGRAFDIAGANLSAIREAIQTVSDHPDLPVKFTDIIVEQNNNDVHVGVVEAKYDQEAIAKVLNEMYSGTRVASIDTNYKTASNFLEGDSMGDFFEQSPMFIDREELAVEIHDMGETEAKKLATEEPDKFFYQGLYKTFPNLEAEALKHMIENNAKFFFVFKYYDRSEEVYKQMTEHAAELLSLQDVRAFFYYHLHQKFPELGRGAIIQLIDLDPGSFFDLGLDKDYQDYIESANNARNIVNPQRTQVEVHADINVHDIEKVYELEYKITKLKAKGQNAQYMEEQLTGLLKDGVEKLHNIFKNELLVFYANFNEQVKIYKEELGEDLPKQMLNRLEERALKNPKYTQLIAAINDKSFQKGLKIAGAMKIIDEDWLSFDKHYTNRWDKELVFANERLEYKTAEEVESVIEDLLQSNPSEEIKKVFEQKADDKMKVELDEDEKKIFDLFKEVKAYYKLPVELRVAGGWVRDAILKKERK